MYYYKKLTLEQALANFHKRHPEFAEIERRINSNEEDISTEDFLNLSREYSRLAKKMPFEQVYTHQPSGDTWIDIVRGYCPVKLLFRCHCPKKIPLQPILDVVKSQKRRHKAWGPYDHKLRINIYDQTLTPMITLEVDLWQDIQEEKVIEDVKEAVKVARTCVRTTRVCRI